MHLSSLRFASLVSLLAACTPAAVDPVTTSTGEATSATPVTAGDPGVSSTGGPTGGATDSTTAPPVTSQPTADDDGDTALGDCAHNFVFECDVPKPECDVWAQDCGPGEKCSAYAQPASERWKWSTRCVPVEPDPALPGEPCVIQEEMFAHGKGYSGIDDCDATSACWQLEGDNRGNPGECLVRCTGSEDAPVCPQGTGCVSFGASGQDGGQSLHSLCVESCDPLIGDCPADQQCLLYKPIFSCQPDTSPDSNPVHGACDEQGDCAAGLLCVPFELSGACDPQFEGCCLAFCDTTIDPNPACSVDAGETCTTFWGDDPPTPGLEHVGFCNDGG